jgi:hypothetical protein
MCDPVLAAAAGGSLPDFDQGLFGFGHDEWRCGKRGKRGNKLASLELGWNFHRVPHE